jgi:hypothetical protein
MKVESIASLWSILKTEANEAPKSKEANRYGNQPTSCVPIVADAYFNCEARILLSGFLDSADIGAHVIFAFLANTTDIIR